ncbi:MAG: metallophosphoesterase, partial [bacterium]
MRGQFDFERAAQRFGRAFLGARLNLQAARAAAVFATGRRHFLFENAPRLHRLIGLSLKAAGIYGIGARGFRDIRIVDHHAFIPGLPPAFEGFVILQLSDLHLDLDPTLTNVILNRLSGCRYDICVFTGDYRNLTHGPFNIAVDEMERLVRALIAPAYAILGNHDFIESVDDLEATGLRFLVNEGVEIERCGARLALLGVDDPNVYMTDNLPRAMDAVDSSLPTVLLSHSCCLYRRARALGIDFMLSGHTHGGQICLPGGVAVITSEPSPRRMV